MDNVRKVKPGSLQWGLVIAGFTTNEAHDFCHSAGRKTFNQLRGRLEITWPQFEQDLIDALEDKNFVNNGVRMERKIRESMVTTGYTNT